MPEPTDTATRRVHTIETVYDAIDRDTLDVLRQVPSSHSLYFQRREATWGDAIDARRLDPADLIVAHAECVMAADEEGFRLGLLLGALIQKQRTLDVFDYVHAMNEANQSIDRGRPNTLG